MQKVESGNMSYVEYGLAKRCIELEEENAELLSILTDMEKMVSGYASGGVPTLMEFVGIMARAQRVAEGRK